MAALDIPEPVLSRAEALAAKRGISVSELVTALVEKEVRSHASDEEIAANREALMKLAGGLRHLNDEAPRINAILEEEFEQIEPEMWR
jgi:hypothetical protein